MSGRAVNPEIALIVEPLKDQHVLILGLGASGLAMARWCVRCGAQVTVADTRSAPPQLAALQREEASVTFVSGPLEAGLLDDQRVAAVYCSPGLSPVETAMIVGAANARQIRVAGELHLFSKALDGLRDARGYRPKVLAVTGTNGKTTVTSLTAALLGRCGVTVAAAGNIGPTLLDSLMARLAAGTLPEVWVLELSSFQLHGQKAFEPDVAAVLNITQDHLDWHATMADYVAAKSNIFGRRALLVVNRDDAIVMSMLDAAAGPAKPGKLTQSVRRDHVSFGYGPPQRAGDFGMEEAGAMAWLVRALPRDSMLKRRRARPQELHIQRLMPVDALSIRGRHNAGNALAALALACAAGASLAPMLYALQSYRGEPHRMQSIGSVGAVEFFDDSKGTNVGATVAALNGLGAERMLVAILGGQGKGQDFTALAQPVARHVRAVVLIGQDANEIRTALSDTGAALIEADTMASAVGLAYEQAGPGDAVLMSPACASFDMFDNYEHRARVFCDAVRELAAAHNLELEGAT